MPSYGSDSRRWYTWVFVGVWPGWPACLLVGRGSGREFGLGSKRITWWRSLLEGTGGSWKLCMLPCHNCQNYRARKSKEVGEDFKVIRCEANYTRGTNFYWGS